MINDNFVKSPVPSDEFLYEGEKPFTAFGQWGEGHLDLRVFEQDVYWVNIQGVAFKIEEMSVDYIDNVIAHIREHSDMFHLRMIEKMTLEIIQDALDGKENAEVIAFEMGNSIAHQTATEWAESNVLMRKLLKTKAETAA